MGADRVLASLGYTNLLGASNPFDWMELISVAAGVAVGASVAQSLYSGPQTKFWCWVRRSGSFTPRSAPSSTTHPSSMPELQDAKVYILCKVRPFFRTVCRGVLEDRCGGRFRR